jgi:hypothetical protein
VFEMGNYLVTRKNHKETQTDMHNFNVKYQKQNCSVPLMH